MVAETAIDFGMVTRSPMIEIVTIGAGGGSIANLDAGGILEIGPESAGSEPGPACYGKGNGTPTVTDANLVLGRINPLTPIGVGIGQLDLDAAKRAIVSHIAKPLGLDMMAAADAIIRVANSKMAGAIRLVSIERGYQPEAFVLMPFGGGGALHAGALIKDVGLSKAVIPRYPGATSAFGCVVADIRLDRVKTINTLLEHLDINRLNEESERLHLDGMRNLEASQLSVKELTVYLELDMNYVGQTHTITVQLPQNPVSVGFIRKAFEQTYRRIYSDVLEGIPVRVLNMRIVMIGKRPEFDLSLFLNAKVESTQTKTIKQRDVWVEGEWQSVRVYQRNQLNAGTVIVGPALIEQSDATVFVDDKLTGTVDTFGNLTLELQ
jgi:N-methylhydantoinase A